MPRRHIQIAYIQPEGPPMMKVIGGLAIALGFIGAYMLLVTLVGKVLVRVLIP